MWISIPPNNSFRKSSPASGNSARITDPYPLLRLIYFSIARRTLNKEIRRSRKIAGISSKRQTESDEGRYNALSQPEAELYLQELTEALEAAKAKLTAKELQAIQAAQQQDIEFHKILEELGCSKEAYEKRIKRARKRLRKFLGPFIEDDETPKKR